jgi:hypothetical protein
VPLFWVGTIGLIATVVAGGSLGGVAFAAACLLVSLALQGRGHKVEENPPEPFAGPANAVARIVLEQWVTFPRFVLSGGWLRALRAGGRAEGRRP